MRRYRINWHHQIIAAYLEEWAFGDLDFLIIELPPRHGKSELASRRLPAMMLGRNPDLEIIACSYAAELASTFNRSVQRIMDSPSFGELFPDVRLAQKELKDKEQKNSQVFEVVGHRGSYKSAGIGGGIVGRGANRLIIDDPVKDAEQARSKAYRDRCDEWYSTTAYSRLEEDGKVLLIQTRWHEDDLAGRLIKRMEEDPDADQFTILRLPAIAEPRMDKVPFCDFDEREPGEALWPSKYPAERLLRIKRSVGSSAYNAIWQQRPAALEGGIVKRKWIHYYKTLPPYFERLLISWDFAEKDEDQNDYSVGQVWGVYKGWFLLLDQIRDKMDFPTEVKECRRLALKWSECGEIVIEEKSNGTAVAESVKKDVPGIVMFNPKTSKAARLVAVSPLYESESVLYPDPSIAPWINDNVEEIATYPNALNDDTVDATSQALLRLRGMAGDWDLDEVLAASKRTPPTEHDTVVGGMGDQNW